MSGEKINFKSLSLFKELNEEELGAVTQSLKPVKIKKGESIIKEGDAGEDMFIFISGTLSAFGTQSDGTQRWLFDVKPGDFFGEMSVIAHEPRSATIKAAADSLVVVFHGDDFYRIISQQPVTGFKILRAISIVQNQWLDQSSKSYNDLIRWGEAARRRAITDEMTGLYNRLFLEESIKERFNNQPIHLRTMSLLMMDLDKIHAVNNLYGAKAGDLVIIAAANIIHSCIRHGDIAARLSGDEFAVLLPDTNEDDAASVAGRIRELIEKCRVEVPAGPDKSENVIINTCTSIGIASTPFHAKTAKDLMDFSDEALRRAKDLGRNRVEIYS